MSSLTRSALGFVVFLGVGTRIAPAQSVISAKSGLIHYMEGRVFLNDQLIESQFGEFPDLKENQQLRTEDGRVEVLLTPGVFLRMGEDSALRMVTNRLVDTRLDLLSGEVLLEADELLEGNSVTITYQDYAVHLVKKGVYRLTSGPAELRVYSGEASVDLNGETKIVKEGHVLAMNGDLRQAKFDKKDVDDLYRWSRHRSEYIALANVSAARTLRDSGMYWGTSGWYWNPYYGMFTFIPLGGVCYNPWGFAFWSPFTVYGFVGSNWPWYAYPVSESSSGSSSGTGTGSAPGARHHSGRIGHPPVGHPPIGQPPPGQHPGNGIPRGVTVAGEAHRSVAPVSAGHAGGSSGGSGGSGHSAAASFSSGGSSGGASHSSAGASSNSSSSSSGSHK